MRLFSGNRIEEFKLNFNDVETNITVKTHNVDGKDQKIRLKAIGVDESGIFEFKIIQLQKMVYKRNVKKFLTIYRNMVEKLLGAGKGKFAGGTEIPQGN